LSSPFALAIANPDNIDFGTGTIPLYKVFENVQEDGDMLFVAEGWVNYAVTPTDYDANESFLFEVLDTTGTTTLLSTSLNDYGDRPISIYQSASQVTALGLVSGTAYGVRITGNPLIFGSPVGNTITAYLTSGDYVDQLLGEDGEVATNNPLRNFLIGMAENIEEYDAPTDSYLTTVQGTRYLTIDGGDLFITGLPGISSYCPILFQATYEYVSGDTPESTGAYDTTLTPLAKWGATTANGLTMLGVYLGVSQEYAGLVMLFAFCIAFSVWVYRQTNNKLAVTSLVAVVPFAGAYLGFISIAIAFIVVIILAVLMGYYFFSRGAI
jgi:hypothetical protein